jgi:predicted amidophosphoribosyltransferase
MNLPASLLETARPQEPQRKIPVVTPPLPGPGVCRICRGPARESSHYCWCCRQVCSVLGESPASVPRVQPIVVFRPGDSWSVVLRRYKDAPVVAARRHFSSLLAQEVERFLTAHGDCLRTRTLGFDSYCVVPTSRPQRRVVAPHPLEALLAGVAALAPLCHARLSPAQPTEHLHPSTGAFEVVDPASVTGRRILVVDDSWVTGARALSAVVALEQPGATVAGILVLGRSVDPSASVTSRSWWASLGRRANGASFGRGPCSDECLVPAESAGASTH